MKRLNTIAVVRFADGSLLFTAYKGMEKRVHYLLRENLRCVLADPFKDPDWELWLRSGQDEHQMNEFFEVLDSRVYFDPQDVEIYVPEAGGFYYSAKATLLQKRLLDGTHPSPSETTPGEPAWMKDVDISTANNAILK